MQLANMKISNLLSYPYIDDLSSHEGIRFYNRENNNVNVLIGPNGAGKSGFLHIFRQIFKVAILNDYFYDRQSILTDKKKVITINEQFTQGLRPHFTTPDMPSQVIAHFTLTQHDYDNMQYICDHAETLNRLITTYSTLDISYPTFSPHQIRSIPKDFMLACTFDVKSQKVSIDEDGFSVQEKFVLLYLQTIELIQIFIDIYNDHERPNHEEPLVPLANCIGMIGADRSMRNVSNTVDPHAWNHFIGDKFSSEYRSYIGFYLCAKKVRNIISDHSTLEMSEEDVAQYPQKLEQSEFYTSLVGAIKKYFNKTLYIEYANQMLTFILIDQFGQRITFADLSDGEQYLISMIFTMYGYDLNHGIIIVDEPEIHFHPQMQRSFSRMIEKMNQHIGTQFIISTYSPLFINESNIGNVYRFSNIDGSTRVKNPFLALSPDEATLVHLLKFENLSKIFFVNNIIMVEGETDAYFFEFYLRYLHTLPERKDVLTDYEIININGKGSYRVRNRFLSRFGLESYFIGDRDNIVDYGFMSQNDLAYYYKQAKNHYLGLRKSGKTHRHYNKLVDTIMTLFPQKYSYLVKNIDELYKSNVFILKKGDIETYLGMPEKGLENTVKFCHYDFKKRLDDVNFDSCRKEFAEIFSHIFR